MKKALLFTLMLLFLSFCVVATTEYDYYYPGTADFYEASGQRYMWTSMNVTSYYVLKNISIMVWLNGAGDGSKVMISVRNFSNNGLINANDLINTHEYANTTGITAASLPGLINQWTNFSLNQEVILPPGKYFILFNITQSGSTFRWNYKDGSGTSHAGGRVDNVYTQVTNDDRAHAFIFYGSASTTAINVLIDTPSNGTIFSQHYNPEHRLIWINSSSNDTQASCEINSTLFSFNTSSSVGGYKNYSFLNNTFLPEDRYDVNVTCNRSDLIKFSAYSFFYVSTFKVFNVNYSGWVNSSGELYARALNYSIDYICPTGYSSTYNLLYNNTINLTAPLSCDNTRKISNYSVLPTTEAHRNISFYFNTTYPLSPNTSAVNTTFIFDLNAPSVSYYNMTIEAGFSYSNTTLTLICTDTAYKLPLYNVTVNGVTYLYNNFSSGSSKTANASLSGTNTAYFTCSDPFSTRTDTLQKTIYIKTLILIDEVTGNPFDVNNVSNLTVYLDDNSTFYLFKTSPPTNSVNFTAIQNTRLRFEIKYGSGDIIIRYVDASIEEASEIRVCANKDDVTHYEQIVISSTERPVTIKSVYANCVVGQDNTRFVYQDNLVLKIYTMKTLYYLYTYDDDGNKVYLASMDGSFQTYYNIDVLEFNQQGYNIGITGDTIGISKSATAINIYYESLDNNSVSTQVIIKDVNTSTVLFNTTETASPNLFYMYFDYSTLGLSNSSIFSVQVTKTTSTGAQSTTTKYFSLAGRSGLMPSGFAFAIGVLCIIFGLTFTVTRASLGWFGIIVMLVSIAVLSMAVASWYVTLLLVMSVIILIYIVLLLVQQNYGAVA